MAVTLPEDTMYEIFSRIPFKSLARFRCVCKQWRDYINDPHLENIHHLKEVPKPLYLAEIKSPSQFHQRVSVLSFLGVMADGIQMKKDLSSRFLVKRNSIKMLHTIQGYCHGLITLLRQNHRGRNRGTTFVVINPLTKDCHDVPLLKRPGREKISGHGLGFDNSTNTFKMVCVVNDHNRVKVHILGTDSWQEIPQVLCHYYNIRGRAVYASGRLHWYAHPPLNEWKIVWLDMKKVKFGMTDPPAEQRPGFWYTFQSELVDLNGELGLVNHNSGTDGDEVVVWILKHEDQWIIHCVFKPPRYFDTENVIGCWNKDGDILIKGLMTNAPKGPSQLLVYKLKNDSFHYLVGPEDDPGEEVDYIILMYQSSLLSMRKLH